MNGASKVVPTARKLSNRIGLMGGSFDPIHYGHLVLAEEVRQHLNLDRVIFIPVGRAPHKAQFKMADPEVRCKMVELAISDNPYFELSRLEIDSEATSYTIHTLRKMKELYGADFELFFITGADTLLDLENWYEVEEVLKLCTFVGATRPGYVSEELIQKAQTLRETFHAKIELIAIPGLAISSTEIRERLQKGMTVKYLLPETVEHFIVEESIYEKEDQ
jgi:nicotinate-nucleotide adenylyltransferase